MKHKSERLSKRISANPGFPNKKVLSIWAEQASKLEEINSCLMTAMTSLPRPVGCLRDGSISSQRKRLSMEYGEWYDNVAIPTIFGGDSDSSQERKK